MAEFNVTPQPERPDNFIGYSRGIDHTENTALGTLFGTVADTLKTGAVAADRIQQEHIQNQIFDEVDAIQDEFGVGDATLFQSDAEGPQPTPVSLERAGENLTRLQAAHDRGALTNSHYWARLNSMVRQLRTQYPGYRAEIDEMVAGVTGARPANALRAALFDEWDAASSDTTPLAKLEDWAIKNGRMPVDYFVRQEQGNPYSLVELEKHISHLTLADTQREDRRKGLALMAEEETLTSKDAERAFRVESNQHVMTMLGNTQSQIGMQYRALKGQIASAQAHIAEGGVPSGVDLQKLKGSISDLRMAVHDSLRQMYTTPWSNDPKMSYVEYLSQDEAQKIIDDAMTPLVMLETALANEQFGLLGSISTWIEASNNDAMKDIMEEIPMVAALQGMQGLLGENGMNIYMSLNPDLQHTLAQAILDYQRANVMTDANASVTQAFEQGEALELPAEYYNGLIEGWTNTIDNLETMPLAAVQKNVDYMFGPNSFEVLSTMDDASRFEYFNRVASPMVTEKMRQLREMGDVESWDNYQQWVTRGFLTLFQGKVQQMQGASQSLFTPGMKVHWDDVNSGFVLHVPANAGSTGAPVTTVLSGAETMSAQGAVSEMNAIIRTVKPIIEDNNGEVGPEIYQLLQDMGFDPETQQGFFEMMMTSIGEMFAPAKPAVEDDRG